jgi:tripartite-type tricarboxylate transporter receptor subunit TctC
VNGAVYPLQYDLRSDFQPISLLASPPLVIVSTNAVPAQDLKGLIDWLKANPDKATQGTGGAGAPSHVSGLQFQAVTGTRFRFVPYRGAAPAMQDLLAGQIDLMFDQIPNALPHVNSGRIRAYAVTAKSRLAIAPDIPTVDEAGLPGFYFSNWHGLWVPKGTPANVVGKLNAAVVESLADQMVRSRLAELGFEIFPREQQTPEALAAHHKAEIEKWWPIIRAAGIAPE